MSDWPSLTRRLAAIFYDTWLVLACIILAGALMVGLRVLLQGAPDGEPALGGYWRIPTFIVMLLVICHFFVYFWIKNSQTLAMQSWRIQVVDDKTGGNITLQQAYLRFFAACLSWASLGLGYLWMLIDKQHKTWHDHLSGTRLVLVPKPDKNKRK